MRRSTRDLLLLMGGLLVFGPTLAAMATDNLDQMKAIVTPYVMPVLLVLLALALIRIFLRPD